MCLSVSPENHFFYFLLIPSEHLKPCYANKIEGFNKKVKQSIQNGALYVRKEQP